MVADHELVDVSAEHGLDVAGLDPGTDVFDELVRVQDVVADLRSEANVLLLAPERIDLFSALLLLELVEAGAQDRQRGVLVLELRLLVLTGHDGTRRYVRDAHRRVGRVHRLPARSARPIDVDAQVLLADVDLDLLGEHRQHVHAREGGLAALLLIGGADTHKPVHAHLRAEHPVGIAPVHGEQRPVQSEFNALRRIVQVDLPALALGVLRVHTQKHLGPVLRLEPALTGNDRDDRVTVVELAAEP